MALFKSLNEVIRIEEDQIKRISFVVLCLPICFFFVYFVVVLFCFLVFSLVSRPSFSLSHN